MTDPITSEHYDGLIPNASRTPRNEVGGLAVFEGVLMRSRTGFAIAVRKDDGSISVMQVPFASLVTRKKGFGLPIIRGATALGEMMVIGTRAMIYSSADHNDDTEEEVTQSAGKVATMIGTSLALLLTLFVVVPDLAASLLLNYTVHSSTSGNVLTDADYPLLFNLYAGIIRIAILLGYILSLGWNTEIRRLFQYHGAEHKAVLALEEGRDVTVGRARVHDTIHPRCGTTLLTTIALLSVVLFAVADSLLLIYISNFPAWPYIQQKLVQFLAHLVMLPVAIGVSFELMKYCTRNWQKKWCRRILWPGTAMQRLTTRQPDDRQLEVAIVSLFGALAISPGQRNVRRYVVRGLEDDETAPGFIPRSPARPAPAEPPVNISSA